MHIIANLKVDRVLYEYREGESYLEGRNFGEITFLFAKFSVYAKFKFMSNILENIKSPNLIPAKFMKYVESPKN